MPRAASSGRRELFVDTSAWIPLLLKRHADHSRVRTVLLKAVRVGGRAVTTNLVLAETFTFLRYRGHFEVALQFIRAVRKPPNIVVTSTEELEQRAAMDWLQRFEDQDFSFTDSVSFAVMQDRGITRALTLDHHFLAAGFEVVPSAG